MCMLNIMRGQTAPIYVLQDTTRPLCGPIFFFVFARVFGNKTDAKRKRSAPFSFLVFSFGNPSVYAV